MKPVCGDACLHPGCFELLGCRFGATVPSQGLLDHLLMLAAAAACLLLLSRLEPGPSWVLVLRNAWEITVEERPLALEMSVYAYGDCRETRLENGSFSPQNGPPRGTMAWYTPY